jgi:hypothetical protein
MSKQDFHIRCYSCRLTVTWLVPLVKQILITLPEHMGSLQQSIYYFCVVFLFLLCLAFVGVRLLIALFLVSSNFCWRSKPGNFIKVTKQIYRINIYRPHLSTGKNWTHNFSGEDTDCIGWYKSNYITSNIQWNFVYSWYVSLSYRFITPIIPLGVVKLGVRRHMLCLMTRNISLKQPQRGSMQIIKTPMEMSCHRT